MSSKASEQEGERKVDTDLWFKQLMEKSRQEALEEESDDELVSAGTSSKRTSRPKRRNLASSSKTFLDESSSENEDELAEMDIDKLLNQTNSKKSTKRRAEDESFTLPNFSNDEEDEENDENSEPQTSHSPTELLPSQRPKREAARKLPYNFKLKLQKPSDIRQVILDSSHSAAVKYNMIKPDEWNQGRRRIDNNENVIKKLNDVKRKERKAGVATDDLKRSMEIIEKYKAYSKQDDLMFGSDDDLNTSFDDSNDSNVSSDEDNAFPQTPSNKRMRIDDIHEDLARFQKIKSTFLKSTSDDEGDDENDKKMEAVELIENDRNKGNMQEGKEEDFGLIQRRFFKECDLYLPLNTARLNLDNPQGLLLRLQKQQTDSNEFVLVQILKNQNLFDRVEDQSIEPLASWLVSKAILHKSQHVSSAAIRALQMLMKKYPQNSLQVTAHSLITSLRTLGMSDEILPDQINVKYQVKEIATNGRAMSFQRLSRDQKALKISNAIVIFTMIGKEYTSTTDVLLDNTFSVLILCLLGIIIDQDFDALRSEARRALQILFDAKFFHTKSLEWDMKSCEEVCSHLKNKYPSTRLAYLDGMPNDTVRSRALLRNIASQLITTDRVSNYRTPKGYLIPDNFDSLLNMLNEQDPALNPLWIKKGVRPDWVQMEANIAILQFCFTDIFLQLSILNKPREKITESRKRAHDRLMMAGIEELIRNDPTLSEQYLKSKSEFKSDEMVNGINGKINCTKNFRLLTDKSKADQIGKIIDLLYKFNIRILENTSKGGGGGGALAGISASESQIRSKDSLQRNALLLNNQLRHFNLQSKDGNGNSNMHHNKQDQSQISDYFFKQKTNS